MKMNKKGLALANLTPIILTFVLIGILVASGLLVYDKLGEKARKDTTTAENVTLQYNVAVSLSHSDIFDPITVVNASNTSQTVPESNYTINKTAGTITETANGTWAGESVTVTYHWYDYSVKQYTSINETSKSIGDFTSWFALIVVVVAAGIILGIVIKSFGKFGEV